MRPTRPARFSARATEAAALDAEALAGILSFAARVGLPQRLALETFTRNQQPVKHELAERTRELDKIIGLPSPGRSPRLQVRSRAGGTPPRRPSIDLQSVTRSPWEPLATNAGATPVDRSQSSGDDAIDLNIPVSTTQRDMEEAARAIDEWFGSLDDPLNIGRDARPEGSAAGDRRRLHRAYRGHVEPLVVRQVGPTVSPEAVTQPDVDVNRKDADRKGIDRKGDTGLLD
jgi:hypothetical protein